MSSVGELRGGQVRLEDTMKVEFSAEFGGVAGMILEESGRGVPVVSSGALVKGVLIELPGGISARLAKVGFSAEFLESLEGRISVEMDAAPKEDISVELEVSVGSDVVMYMARK